MLSKFHFLPILNFWYIFTIGHWNFFALNFLCSIFASLLNCSPYGYRSSTIEIVIYSLCSFSHLKGDSDNFLLLFAIAFNSDNNMGKNKGKKLWTNVQNQYKIGSNKTKSYICCYRKVRLLGAPILFLSNIQQQHLTLLLMFKVKQRILIFHQKLVKPFSIPFFS